MPLLLDIDGMEMDAIRRSVGASEALGEQAMRAALRKTIRWAATRVRPKIAEAAGVKQKVIKNRFKIRNPKGKGMSAALWIGTEPIAVIHLGAKQHARGVRAGGRDYAGSFIATMKHGNRHVFTRETKARSPVVSEKISIHAQVMQAVSGTTFAGIEAFFARTFRHEMQWRLDRA